MPTELVVIGAGGFGREALDVIEAHNATGTDDAFTVLGVIDDSPSEVNLARLASRGIRHLGTLGDAISSGPRRFVLGIGNPATRATVAARLAGAGWLPVAVVHPTAVIGSQVGLGAGVIVCAGVQVSTNVRLGQHVHLNPNATIGHDSTLGDHVSINPGAIVSGEVSIGPQTLVGAGAIILQGLTVGSSTTIGAGAVVTKPVPDAVVVKGIPGVWA